MEKIEYGELSKFLVSIGITLIVIAFLLPWLYLREPFDLLITQDKLLKFTENAQIIIKNRQNFILESINYIQYASLFLIVLGVLSIGIGLWKWIKKQNDLDEREKIITETHKHNFKKLSQDEVSEKAENEFVTLKQDTKAVIVDKVLKEDFVPKYLQLERGFFEKLMKFYYNDFRILSNYRINRFEYDIILESRYVKKLDYIFEIKYYPKRYSRNNLNDALLNLENSTKSYTENTGRNAKPIMIIVVHEEDFSKKELLDLNQFAINNLEPEKEISLGVINFNDLESITKEQINDLLYNNGKRIE